MDKITKKFKRQSLLTDYDKNSSQYLGKKRAVSDIIVTLLLVAITIIGGIMAWVIVSGEGGALQDVGSAVTEPPETSEGGIKIIAYDTRDGDNIGGLDEDNSLDGVLNGGEYIVLTVVNDSPRMVVLNDFKIKSGSADVSHTHDADGSLDEGTFIVLSSDATDTDTPLTAELNAGITVKVVIRLANTEFNADPLILNREIRISLDASRFDLQQFIITAGSLK